MNSIEQIAIRALLRHYWRKGADVETAVVEICATEGSGSVDAEMVAGWFARFEAGDTSIKIESEEIISSYLLPNETWREILRFVPFRSLHESIPYVSTRFDALADTILDRLHPRNAKPIVVKWNEENFTHTLALETPNSYSPILLPFPDTSPPPNILGFERISVQGQLDRELLSFLEQCGEKIDKCKVDFLDLDNFMGALAQEWILIEDFCAPMKSCVGIVLYRRVPSEFLTSHFVLSCSTLEVHWAEFQAMAMLEWLKYRPEQRMGAGKHLTIYGYYGSLQSAEPVNLMLATLISERREGVTLNVNFTLELFDFEDVLLHESDDGVLALRQLSDTNWWLGYRGAPQEEDEDRAAEWPPGDAQQNGAEHLIRPVTVIEIGRFF